MYRDRQDAGRRLAIALDRFAGQNPVVLALVRGGVVVGEEVARALRAPLDIVLVRKIGAPSQPELAVGAVANGPYPQIVTNPGIVDFVEDPDEYIAQEAEIQLKEISRRRSLYLSGRESIDIMGKIVIVVDDGIATGATTRAALRAVRRRRPFHLVLAVPVAPAAVIRSLRHEADEIVCLEAPKPFRAISLSYEEFSPVSDEDVIGSLDRSAKLWADRERTSRRAAP